MQIQYFLSNITILPMHVWLKITELRRFRFLARELAFVFATKCGFFAGLEITPQHIFLSSPIESGQKLMAAVKPCWGQLKLLKMLGGTGIQSEDGNDAFELEKN